MAGGRRGGYRSLDGDPGFVLASAVYGGDTPKLEEFQSLHQMVNLSSQYHLMGLTIGKVVQIHLVLRFAGSLLTWNGLDPIRKVTNHKDGTVLGLEVVFRAFDLNRSTAQALFRERMPIAVERACRVNATRDHQQDLERFRVQFDAFMDDFY